ncbi:MAG: phosphoglucomutase [Termitinemataceae bacterium]|nr:MAG: phosphoglucomutase [Termitinemataceae bacterium]
MILSASGWRDVFSIDGNEEGKGGEIDMLHKKFAVCAAKVFADYVRSLIGGESTIVVGMDTRPTGRSIADTVMRSLVNSGCTVLFAGVTAAPEIMAFASHAKNISAFIYISASHNPIGHNGIKFGLTDGGVLPGKEIQKLIDCFHKIFDDESLSSALLEGAEKVSQEIIDKIITDSARVKKLSLKHYYDFTNEIVFDKQTGITIKGNCSDKQIGVCADLNGSARTLSIDAQYFADQGIKFAAINDAPGMIAHKIVPEDDALLPCCRFLEEQHLKDKSFVLGYVPDCDGDRGNIVIWDEGKNASRALEAQEVFALAVLSELSFLLYCGKADNLAIAVNDPTSMRIDHICAAFGAEVYRAEVGEANVVSLGRQLRQEGKTVRILGEGSAGGNITHPSAVRDPIDTVMSIVKLLTLRSSENKKGLFEIWCEQSGQKRKYKNDFTLADIISTMPSFFTTGTYSEDAVLKISIKDHAEFKRAYQIIFVKEWEEKKDILKKSFGITDWEACAYNGTEERENIADFGIAGKGGLKIYFLCGDFYTAAIWMRGSATEPVFRIMADAADADLERILIKWQKDMVLKNR